MNNITQILRNSLRRDIDNAKANLSNRKWMNSHLNGCKAAISNSLSSNQRSLLNSDILELIRVLGYWPILLERGIEWFGLWLEAEKICEQSQNYALEAIFITYRTIIQFDLQHDDEASILAEKAIQIAHKSGSLRVLTTVIAFLITHLRADAERMDRVFKRLSSTITSHQNDLLSIAQSDDIFAFQTEMGLIRALSEWRAEHFDAALSLTNEVVQSVAQSPIMEAILQSAILMFCNQVYWAVGEYESAIQCLKDASRIFQQMGDNKDFYNAQAELGLNYWSLGKLVDANRGIEKENQKWNIELIGHLVLVYLAMGDIPEALEYVNSHIEKSQNIAWSKEIARGKGNRGVILVNVPGADLQEAKRLLLEDYWLSRSRSVDARIGTEANLALCNLAMGNSTRARYWSRRVLSDAKKTNMLVSEVAAMRCLGQLRGLIADDERKQYLEKALEKAVKIKRSLEEAACLLWLSELEPDSQKQEELWERGARLLKICGASKWLNDVDKFNAPPICILI